MKYMRLPDLTTKMRIDMVMNAWFKQGIYGEMTKIAKQFKISRTFLYQSLTSATDQLERLFSDSISPPKEFGQIPLEKMILLLRLEGKSSLSSISLILKELSYKPNSLGYLSQFLKECGHSLPSTLSFSEKKEVFYLSDEIFAINEPILVTVDAKSTAILKIELADNRSAETWKKHFQNLENSKPI